MVGRAKQSQRVGGSARQGRRRQRKQSKASLRRTRQGTEGKARPRDSECLSLGRQGHSASVAGADVKVPWGGIVQQDISLLAPVRVGAMAGRIQYRRWISRWMCCILEEGMPFLWRWACSCSLWQGKQVCMCTSGAPRDFKGFSQQAELSLG